MLSLRSTGHSVGGSWEVHTCQLPDSENPYETAVRRSPDDWKVVNTYTTEAEALVGHAEQVAAQ